MTKKQIYQSLLKKYRSYSNPEELWIKAEKIAYLNKLAKKKNAVILKHNYMTWDLQCDEVEGIRGDSLELSRKAAETQAETILFLGVKFMAETAKILNPDKMVLIPSLKAGCSLAESINSKDIRKLKQKYPKVPVVAYINTDADTKTEVDVCCASGNAVEVVRWVAKKWKTKQVIFLPDEYLGKNIAKQVKADGIELILWHGKCEVHEKFTPEDVDMVRKSFDNSYIMAHPECHPDVIAKVDFAGSTGEMLKKVTDDELKDKNLAVLTECAMVEMLAANHPKMITSCSILRRCPHMALNSLETAIEALEKNQFEITLDEKTRAKAELPIRRMLEIKRK